MECEKCGCKNLEGQKFCGDCGTKLQEKSSFNLDSKDSVNCPSCDAPMPKQAGFCGLCGHSLQVESQSPDLIPEKESAPEKKQSTLDPYGTTIHQEVAVKGEEELHEDDLREGEAESRSPTDSIREMILVKEGWFTMGSASGEGKQDEHPLHQVQLRAFYIDKYAVSNIEYEKFNPKHRRLRPEEAANDFSPVVFVSYQDCLDYCDWRSEQEGLKQGTYSLPTEAQWEKSARGGYQQRLYPWGHELVANAYNTREADLVRTLAIDKCIPNGFGLYHMGGNIREWCFDYYLENFYTTRAATILDPEGPQRSLSIIMNVVRGASFQDLAADLGRCAARNYAHPSNSSSDTGFRCVRLDR